MLLRQAFIPLKSTPFFASSPKLVHQYRNMSSYSSVSTDKAPAALGPYTQAIKTDSLVFLSGSIPLIPETGKIVEGGVEEQTKQALKNMTNVAEASGVGLKDIVKTTVCELSRIMFSECNEIQQTDVIYRELLTVLKNMDDFAKVNAIYAAHFGEYKPARSCVEVARLPMGVLFEIEAIASIPK